ncbi:MAG: BlaI/MecI/CopY family transcriptional regulator [Acidimicrobiales bacterium]
MGELENEVLERLWAADWLVAGRCGSDWGTTGGAYTTVMTILGRLVEKGLVERLQQGRAHVYRAAGRS